MRKERTGREAFAFVVPPGFAAFSRIAASAGAPRRPNGVRHPNPVTGAPRRAFIFAPEGRAEFLERGSKAISAVSLVPALT